MRMLIALAALMTAMPAAAQIVPDDTQIMQAQDAIMAGMNDSAEGWNIGDIDRFLAVYSDDALTSFTGSEGTAYANADIRKRYLKNYGKQFGAGRDQAGMSKLSFVRESIRLIGADHALLIARWTLTTGDGKTQTGMTSLLFRKEAGGWRIIADHSS